MENCVAPGLDEFDVLLEVVLSLVRVAAIMIIISYWCSLYFCKVDEHTLMMRQKWSKHAEAFIFLVSADVWPE